LIEVHGILPVYGYSWSASRVKSGTIAAKCLERLAVDRRADQPDKGGRFPLARR
jgi:hypothetical protein